MNKRHYEHTLPNIRGSLSNTYLEIIIPIAFRLNTYCTHVFRRWLVEKALAKEKQQAYVMLIHKANGYC